MSKVRPRRKEKKNKIVLIKIFLLHKESHHLLRAAALFPKICLLFCGKQSALQNLGVVPKASIKKIKYSIH